jgi:3-deoxy-D-manno-octulosonic-acid transferase/heptosyltransferase-1
MHLSTALDKITLVLVGPTSPWEIDVFGKGEIIYNNNLNCIACYLPFCNKEINCMDSLSAESIFKILEKYL